MQEASSFLVSLVKDDIWLLWGFCTAEKILHLQFDCWESHMLLRSQKKY